MNKFSDQNKATTGKSKDNSSKNDKVNTPMTQKQQADFAADKSSDKSKAEKSKTEKPKSDKAKTDKAKKSK
jgi:hypothetical protein